MLKILVTYAVQGEFTEIKWPDVEVYLSLIHISEPTRP